MGKIGLYAHVVEFLTEFSTAFLITFLNRVCSDLFVGVTFEFERRLCRTKEGNLNGVTFQFLCQQGKGTYEEMFERLDVCSSEIVF